MCVVDADADKRSVHVQQQQQVRVRSRDVSRPFLIHQNGEEEERNVPSLVDVHLFVAAVRDEQMSG